MSGLLWLFALTANELAAQPSIRSFTPTTTSPGTSVVITGIRFTGASAVSIGGTAAASFTVESDTQITAVVACNNVSGEIVVTTAAGTARLAGFTLTSASLLVTSFSPTSGPPGTVVTVVGRGMQCVNRVTIGGVAATQITTTLSNQSSMSFTVPNGAITGALTLTSPFGSASANDRFTVTVPAPSITGFSPTSGAPGAVITVTGMNLAGATSVSIGGVLANYTVNRDGTVSITIPANAPSGIISITTPGGTATSGRATLTVLPPPPTIASFSPTTASLGATITITGTDLSGASLVTIGGVPAASFTVISPTTITFVVPSRAGNGAITVTTPGGQATSRSVLIVNPASVRIAEEYGMRIFPHPASDAITLEYSLVTPAVVETEMVNLLGMTMFALPKIQQSKGIQRVSLNVQALPAGMYFVQVNIGGKRATVPLQIIR
ncbi:MAG: IPT/TIG domain-containing protein [Ignavibacteria bacterium]|nr:IPT/TIG domain-containing protein [Ignavibacteria bacterium]